MTKKLQKYFKKNEKIIGGIASFLAIIMFFSLIEVMISNLQGKSRILIQPLATSLNGLFWSMYAYGRRDWFLLVPNMLALIIGAITVVSVFI
jgi:hypothetical protein